MAETLLSWTRNSYSAPNIRLESRGPEVVLSVRLRKIGVSSRPAMIQTDITKSPGLHLDRRSTREINVGWRGGIRLRTFPFTLSNHFLNPTMKAQQKPCIYEKQLHSLEVHKGWVFLAA